MSALDQLNDLLRKGWTISCWINPLGTISAEAGRKGSKSIITDDFGTEKALQRLHDKVHQRGMYATETQP